MSDTPRTEKAWKKMVHSGNRSAMMGECAKLARELAALTKERDNCKEWLKCYLPELEQIAKPHDMVRLKLDCKL